MDNDKVNKLIENVLNLLDLSADQYQISFTEDNSVLVNINLPEDQTGIYIGHHGEALTSLQLLLSLMVGQRIGDWRRISLNINDYQERREESLQHLAQTAVDKALALNQEVVLGNLSSYERRLIHLYLENHTDVTTESRGDEPLRQLMIIPKQK